MKKTLLIIASSALVTGLAIKAAPAIAQTSDAAVSVVRTADLDLASPAGQRVLQQRLVIAAHEVCDSASAVDLKARNGQGECRAAVIASGQQRAQALAARNSRENIVLAVR